MLPVFQGTVPQPPDKHKVVAHTPDPNAYHVQGGATMIPRHTPFGASRGFQIRAGVVRLVDIDSDETPGTLVDVERLNAKDVRSALSDTGGDAHEALLHLGIDQGYKVVYGPFTKVSREEDRSNPLKQGYVVPKSNPSGGQYPMQQPGVQMPIPRPVQPTVYAPPPPGQQYAPPAQPAQQPAFQQPPALQAPPPPAAPAPQADPNMVMMQMVMTQMQEMQRQMAEMRAQPALPQYAPQPEPQYAEPEPGPVMAPGGAVKASSAAARTMNYKREDEAPSRPTRSDRSASQTIDEFTESIGLRFLTAEPSKPRIQVYFDMGDVGGKLAAWYHDVHVTGRCLTLTYDNRYEGGTQFVPPFLGSSKQLTLTVPKLNKRFSVYSGDLRDVDGPLDKCMLVIAESEDLSEEHEEE